MSKAVKNTWLRVAVVIVVAALIYVTKPRPPSVEAHHGEHAAHDEHHGEHHGDHHDDHGASEEHHEEPAPPAEEPAPAHEQPQVSAAEHDARDAVVRSAENVAEAQPRQRPRIQPVWRSPLEVSFKRLKQLYRGYRKAKDFTPEEVAELNGAAVTVKGAIMPVDPVGKTGRLKRFWIAKPTLVMAGCVFCNPPTMADLVYVTTRKPIKVDRERLYRSVVMIEALGRLELGPSKSDDGVEYLFGLQLRKVLDI